MRLRGEESSSEPLLRHRFLLALLVATVTVGVSEPGTASEIRQMKSESCDLGLTGDIRSGDAKKLRAFLGSGSRLCLDSPGGSYAEGLALAAIVSENALGTAIESGSKCLSACALVFMAGIDSIAGELPEAQGTPNRRLHVGGKLGFHAPYLNLGGLDDRRYSRREIALAYNVALSEVGQLVDMLRATNTRPTLVAEMLKRGPDDLFLIDTVEAAARWKIQLEGFAPPTKFDERAYAAVCLNHYFEAQDTTRHPVCGSAEECENSWSPDQSEPQETVRNNGERDIRITGDAGMAEVCKAKLNGPPFDADVEVGEVGFYLVNEDTGEVVATRSKGRVPGWFLYPPGTRLSAMPTADNAPITPWKAPNTMPSRQ